MVMTVIVAVISHLTQYIIHTLITPDFLEKIVNRGLELERGTREELIAMTNLKAYMIMTPIMTVVIGAITSAIVSIFVKRAS